MTTFALPPLPVGDRKPKSIADFIARVNAERGGFRNVTQDSLDKEIEDETNGLVEAMEVDTKDASETEDPTDQVDLLEFRKALDEVHMQAKYDIEAGVIVYSRYPNFHADLSVVSRTKTPCLPSTSSP